MATTGERISPNSAMVLFRLFWAWLLATRSALFCCHASPAWTRPWEASCWSTRLARSAGVEAASSLALKSSSLTPAQLRASAKVPVTCPTLMVSLMASARPSMGMESP